MIKTLLALLLLVPTLLFGASIPFSGLNPTQFGSNVSTGKIWAKDGFAVTNSVLTTGTNYGSTGRTNWSWMDASGWHNTNNSAVGQAVHITGGTVGIGTVPTGTLTVYTPGASTPFINLVNGILNTTTLLGFGNSDSIPFLASLDTNSFAASVYGWGFFDRASDGFFQIRYKAGTTAWNTSLTIDRNTGYVGIGTIAPAALLTVNGLTISSNGVASYSSNLLAAAIITIGTSPTSFTNTTTKNIQVFYDGVSVTGTLAINGTVIFNTIGQNTAILQPGEYATATYTVGTPTAKWKPF